MQVFRGLDVIRHRPGFYLPAVTLECIGSCIADDARCLGAKAVHTEAIEGWYVVGAEIDWLHPLPPRVPSLGSLFTSLHVHPTRINGIRAEALVGALARSAYIATPGELQRVVGDLQLPPGASKSMHSIAFVRSVAFTLGGA